MLVALPALRIRGTQLAIVTLAAALTLQEFVFTNAAFNTSLNGDPVTSPSLWGLNLGIQNGRNIATINFGLLTVVVAAILFGVFIVLARGRTGRAWLAVRSNERAALSAGVNVRLVKISGFGIAGFIAGVAGALLTYSVGQLSSDSFAVSVGLELLAVAYLGGITSLSGALIAGAVGPAGIIFVILDAHINFGPYYDLVAGFGLILAAIFNPSGIAGQTASQVEWVMRRMSGAKEVPPGAGIPPGGVPSGVAVASAGAPAGGSAPAVAAAPASTAAPASGASGQPGAAAPEPSVAKVPGGRS